MENSEAAGTAAAGGGVGDVVTAAAASNERLPGGVSDIVKNSMLSVDAAEFVPKFFTPPAPQPQQAPTPGAAPGVAPGVVPGAAPVLTPVPAPVPTPVPTPAPTPAPQRSSVQDRLNIARQAPNVQQVMLQRQHGQPYSATYAVQQPIYPQAYQQYPEVAYQYQQYEYPVDYDDYNSDSVGYFHNVSDYPPNDINLCLAQLDNSIRTLTANPGKFDTLLTQLADTISPFLDQSGPCHDIFDMILEQSIIEGNFRYSGARLCVHLDTMAFDNNKRTSVFRDTLISQCTQRTEEQSESWRQNSKQTDEEEKRCHGLIFFLAELVTQMESEPASLLGKLFIQLISTVLQNPAPTSAKNICQALKLAGQTLERDSSSGNKSDMEHVMRLLTDLVIQGRVDQHVGRMVDSVSELRSGNWGVISSHVPTPLVEIKPPLISQVVVNEPIFYGPDGEIISEEESRFLDGSAESELVQESWETNPVDDAMAEAFEEFLKFSENNNKANQNNVQTHSNQH
ncbi:polyadenylate-binding protein-interacting protein 1 isoform X2 [Phymastichus coffea]|uniref:polyadenylate-binding protein-interacting protein 1 isoform X2 n=1 Tax=Phymastichus coffea TaxID=108790 RepID=UPI00273CDBDB|nr:polyadenylate-binding protein-interacting protein 1 isoform X2 [Phymastichus coffea]